MSTSCDVLLGNIRLPISAYEQSVLQLCRGTDEAFHVGLTDTRQEKE